MLAYTFLLHMHCTSSIAYPKILFKNKTFATQKRKFYFIYFNLLLHPIFTKKFHFTILKVIL